NKWANSVVALKASSGEFVWGFQVVHHDLWDYDVASQPTLFSWHDGTPTGAPLLPVEERTAPKSDIPGEEAWPTQPASTISMVPEKISAEDAWGKTPEEKQACADKIRGRRSEGI